MKKKLTESLSPSLTFGIALLILIGWFLLLAKFKWDFLPRFDVFVFFLFFWLVTEAASQANPNLVESPLKKLLVRYSNRRDRIVVLIAFITTLIVASLLTASKFLRNANPILNVILYFVLTLVTVIVFYYGICLLFGTRELKELILPKLLKRIIYHENPEGE